MINSFITLVAFLAAFFFTSNLQAQVELKADGGSFEDIIPWGEGYLGIVQTQAYAVMPKYRQFQYFNNTGKMAWSQKVTPFNFNNESVCNPASEYAYYVNMPYGKTALTEKTSKTEFLNIYQVSRSGSVVEKKIPYTGALLPLAGLVKKISTCYIAAPKDGIVLVVSTDDVTYHVVRIDSQFNVSYQSATFKWDEKLHEKNQLSRPKFVLGDTQLSIIQLSLGTNEVKAVSKTYNLSDISKVSSNENALNFEGYSLHSNNGFNLEYTVEERFLTSYTREVLKGNTYYSYPTLGKFIEFTYSGNELYAYAYFLNENNGKTEKEGLLMYKLDLSQQTGTNPFYICVFDNDNDNSRVHAVHVGLNDEFVFISRQNKKSTILKTSTGETQQFNENSSIAQAFAAYISKSATADKSAEIDCISPAGSGYVGMDFEGMQNSFGNTKRVVIYDYRK